jgi:ligand-binding sensor domain-containing protein
MRVIYTLLLTLVFAASCESPQPEQVTGEPSIMPRTQISQYIRQIYEDTHGNLWLGTTQDGVCRYDRAAARRGQSPLTYFTKKDGFAGVCVKAIAEDKSGNLWFATEGGVSRFDGAHFTNFTAQDGLTNNDTWSILIDHTGIVWVGTSTGISRFDLTAVRTVGQKKFVEFKFPGTITGEPQSSRFNANQVLSMCQDKSGIVWIGTGDLGLIRYDPTASANAFSSLTTKDGLAGNIVWCMTEDKQGNMWFGTRGGGASRYLPAGGSVKFTNYTQADGLAGNNVGAVIMDNAGYIWFGTSGNGASRLDVNGQGSSAFTTFTDNTGITQNHVQSLYQDRSGTIWFGFSGGLFRLDGKSLVNVAKLGPWE